MTLTYAPHDGTFGIPHTLLGRTAASAADSHPQGDRNSWS